MSGPYGPRCDEILLRQRRELVREMREQFIGVALLYSFAWLSLGTVAVVDGGWRWVVVAGAICIWLATILVTISVLVESE